MEWTAEHIDRIQFFRSREAAVCDALGLPFEGISRRPGETAFSWITAALFSVWTQNGQDDTEHTFKIAQTLLDEPSDIERFSQKLAWRHQQVQTQVSPRRHCLTPDAALRAVRPRGDRVWVCSASLFSFL